MPNSNNTTIEEKTRFSLNDFHLSHPCVVFREADEYGDPVNVNVDIEHGEGGPEDTRRSNFEYVKMSASFKDRDDENRLDDLLHLDPRAGEHVSSVSVIWYGNKDSLPYMRATVFDDDMSQRGCAVPLEDGAKNELMDMIDSAINKTDLERFCEHLDSIGESWSYTDDSKMSIECTYLNSDKPYQVYADGYFLHFENADKFMFNRETSGTLSFNDVLEQEKTLKTVVATLQTGWGNTLTVHEIGSKELMVSEDGKYPRWCEFSPKENGDASILFTYNGRVDNASFKIYLDMKDFYYSEFMEKNLDFHITQDRLNEFDQTSIFPIYTKYDLLYNSGDAPVENKNISYNVYAIDENKNALIGGSWNGIPMKAEWVKPETEEFQDDPNLLGYDISGLGNIYINQQDVMNMLDPKEFTPLGVYRANKNDNFIVHSFGSSEDGHKAALISEQKNGQVLSAQWCKAEPLDEAGTKFQFTYIKNGKNVVIPYDEIKPYKERFADKVKNMQESMPKQTNLHKDIYKGPKKEARS